MFKYEVGYIFIVIGKIITNNISINIIEVLGIIIDIIAVCVTCYIAYRVEKYTKKQDDKILEDNKMQRIANYHSNIILSDNPIKFLFDYKYLNDSGIHTKFAQLFNIYFDKEAVELSLNLKSISSIVPTQAKITRITLWNSKNLNSNSINNDLLKYEYNNTFNSIGILGNDELMISILIGVTSEEKEKINNWINNNEYINISLDITIRNQFNIETQSELYGTYKNYSILNNCYLIKLERKYLKIIKTEEISNE